MAPNAFLMQDAARSYLCARGRKLDRARYGYFFENGDARDVLDELRLFQNPDGGFGHALEPDIRTPASSVIATVHGLDILDEIHAAGTESMVQAALAYLVAQFEGEAQVWPMVSAAVEDAPHAPWWTYAGTPDTFDGFRINPTAAVIAHLWHRRAQLDDTAALDALLPVVAERIVHKGAEMDLNELHTVLALQATAQLPATVRHQVEDALQRAVPAVVAQDAAAWSGYAMQPLQAAPTPDAFAASLLPRSLLEQNLDYWRATQLEDGSWPLPWQWSFVDAAAWAQAEQDWKGFIIVQRLRTVAAYQSSTLPSRSS